MKVTDISREEKSTRRSHNDFYSDMVKFQRQKDEKIRAARMKKDERAETDLSLVMTLTSRSALTATPD